MTSSAMLASRSMCCCREDGIRKSWCCYEVLRMGKGKTEKKRNAYYAVVAYRKLWCTLSIFVIAFQNTLSSCLSRYICFTGPDALGFANTSIVLHECCFPTITLRMSIRCGSCQLEEFQQLFTLLRLTDAYPKIQTLTYF